MKKTLRNKEVKELMKLSIDLGYDVISKKDKCELNDNVVMVNNNSIFFYYENKLVPTLKLLLRENNMKKITVDMGAVPYAVKGADMMRPGIVNIEENINKNDFVSIIDETHHKPIMIGISLFNSEEMKEMKSGKSVKNIHYIGDEIWNN